jgi:hypothetical protein
MGQFSGNCQARQMGQVVWDVSEWFPEFPHKIGRVGLQLRDLWIPKSHEERLERSGITTGRKPVTVSNDLHHRITDRLDFMTMRALVNTP